MQYNIQTQKWHQFSIRTQFYRYGHSCVNYKDKLYIFGGKSKQNGISSELIVLDPNNKSFEVIPNNSNVKPESRFDHSAVVYNHKMYIFGGKGAKGYILDIWSYDFESNTWKKEMLNEPKNSEREKLVGRKSHLSFLINNAMIIIGGESDIPETPTFIIDLNTFQVHYLDDIGNFPPSIRYASGGILSNQEIIVYGGIEYHSKQPLNTFYTLRLSSNWNEGITINRNNSQDEQMFEQNQWSNVLNQNCCHTTISHKATYVPLKSKTPVAPLSIGSRQPLSTDGSRTRSNSEDLTPTARPRRQSSTAAHDRKTRKKLSQSVSIKNVSSTTISIEKLSPNRMAAINYIGEDGVKTISDYSGKAPPPLDIDMNEEPSNKETEQPTNGARPRLSFESGSRKMSFPRFKSNFVEESSNNNNNSESPLNTNSEVNMQNGDDPNLESFPAFRPVSAQRLSPRGGSFSPRSTLIRRNNVSNDNDNAPRRISEHWQSPNATSYSSSRNLRQHN
ncbi:Kelch motif family protein [Histomonas meleagridis]|uniref:Kelch motif family protein n=1 Tax=Histomonas meleagridis TaxID=135588 RepID=UPI003559BDDF|nr:Kelch motif family protein [Histomonas meleagridis]